MARFNRRTVYLLLFAIVLVSLALRYPLVEHERHNDTYFAQLLAESIKEEDRALWTFNPLSYVGYYPASYPSGLSFLLAEFSELTGLKVDLTILLEGFFFGILFALAVFCLSRQFGMRAEYSLLVTFLASVAPRFVDNSYWNGGARAPFIVLAVLLVLVAVRAGSTRQTPLYVFVPILLVGCFAFHHMAILLILFGMAYVLSAVILYASAKNSFVGNSRRHRRLTASIILLSSVLAVVVISIFFLDYFEEDVITGFEKTSLFDFKPAFISALLNLAASYVNQIGFILIFAILGIPSVLRKCRISGELLFLVTTLIVFIPLLANALYISMLLAPFVTILGTIWIKLTIDGKRKRVAIFAVSLLILSSVVLPIWSINRWNLSADLSGDTIQGDTRLFNDGAYLAQFNDEALAISNVDVVGRRLSAPSGVVFPWMGVESALSGDVTRESIEHNLTWGHQDFPKNLYIWFDYEGGPRLDFLIIIFFLQGASFPAGPGDNMPSGAGYYESHSRLLVVVDNRWSSNYVWVWQVMPAKLPSELMNAKWTDTSSRVTHPLSSYMIYQSERISLFALEVPE